MSFVLLSASSVGSSARTLASQSIQPLCSAKEPPAANYSITDPSCQRHFFGSSSARHLVASSVASSGRALRRAVPCVPTASAQSQSSPSSQISGSATQKPKVSVRFLEINCFIVDVDGFRVYVDPLLKGDLTFAGQDWFFRGKKRFVKEDALTDALPGGSKPADLILISQKLPDHCHEPTLQALPKDIPVVACPGADDICRQLGFKNVTTLKAGQSTVAGPFEILATAGALVGPPWEERQNGYLIRSTSQQLTMFYEPHNDWPREVLDSLPNDIDIIVGPVIRASLPILGDYPLVKGADQALQLVRATKPRFFVPLLNFTTENFGLLPPLIRVDGSIPEFERKVKATGLPTQVVSGDIGTDINVPL